MRNDFPNSTVLIYDGQCDFCIAWLRWLQQKVAVTAISYHESELAKYGLTQEECSKSVFVITPTKSYAGAPAIACLLKARGNLVPAFLIRALGPIGRIGYRWIATHRSSLVIRYWTKLMERRIADES